MRRKLADGKKFDNPPFDFIEPVVIFIENAPRLGNINGRFFWQTPRQLDQPIEIGANHSELCRRFWHSLQPAQFLACRVLDLLWHTRLGDRLAQLGHLLGLSAFTFAELALDRCHLLTQQNLALALVQGGLGLTADFLR